MTLKKLTSWHFTTTFSFPVSIKTGQWLPSGTLTVTAAYHYEVLLGPIDRWKAKRKKLKMVSDVAGFQKNLMELLRTRLLTRDFSHVASSLFNGELASAIFRPIEDRKDAQVRRYMTDTMVSAERLCHDSVTLDSFALSEDSRLILKTKRFAEIEKV